MTSDRTPGKFEFEFLRFLSENPKQTSRLIYERFGMPRGYVRGTVVKAIDRLYRKGQLSRDLVNGVYAYSATTAATSTDQELIASFVRDRLEGRIAPLVAFFADTEHLDSEQLAELKALLSRFEGEQAQ